MKGRRYVRKLIPAPLYDLPALEAWLEALAAQGLHLEKLSSYWGVFRPGACFPGVRYRLEPASRANLGRENALRYQESGWRLICPIGALLQVYRADDPSSPELHTDPVAQGLAMRSLMRWLLFAVAIDLVVIAAVLRSSLLHLAGDPSWFLRFAIERTEFFLLLLLLVIPWMLVRLIPDLLRVFHLGRLRKRLLQGVAAPRSGKRHVPPLLPDAATVLLLVAVCASAIVLEGRLTAPLSQETLEAPPFVSLSQVAPQLPREQTEVLQEGSFRASLLAPEQYQATARGYREDSGRARSDAYLYQAHYRTLSREVARLLEACKRSELRAKLAELERSGGGAGEYVVVSEEFTPLDAPGFDSLSRLTYTWEPEQTQVTQYVGRSGTQVVVLSCSGAANPALCLERLCALF